MRPSAMRLLLLISLVLGHWSLVISAASAADDAEEPRLVTLAALLADRYQTTGDLRLSWHRPPPATVPLDTDLAVVSAPPELSSQILVGLRATDTAGRPADFTLVVRAELWREGWALRQPAPLGAALTATALDSRPYDALRERDALALDPASPELDFARAVPAGRLLVWRDVIRRPLVRRGQSVDVLATDGALTVSLRAVALHDAARGEPVRVRNPDSRREFVATVVAESRASVRF